MTQEDLSFEKSFERLEQILEEMNRSKISLEDSLKLFEEAEKLIQNCNKRLSSAEKRIEQLLKNKGELILDDRETKPQTSSFGSVLK